MNGGGAERVALFLAPVLAEAGHTVDLVVARRFGPLCDDPVARTFAVHLDAPNEMLCLPHLLRYLDAARPDLLFAMVHSAKLMAGLAKQRRPGLNLAISVHNTLSLPRTQRFWPRAVFGYGLERWLYRDATSVHVVSDALAEEVHARMAIPRDRITRIYNPVLLRGTSGLADPAHAAWFDRPCLLSAGRMVNQKNQRDLIAAFARAGLAGRARLVLFGDGPLRSALAAEAARLGVGDDLVMPGYVGDLTSYLQRCQGFVLSSRNEGLPLVLLEALGAGCAVAAYDCPTGPAEILDHGRFGTLLPRGDVAGLARAMGEMVAGTLSRPDPQGVASHCAQFDPATVAAAYREYFARLVG